MIDKEAFKAVCKNVVFDEPMRCHTTFKIGGAADIFAMPESEDEVRGIAELCRKSGIPYMIMGNGSNMLVSDKGIRGAVIQIGKNMSSCSIDGEKVYAQAGILMSALANAVLNEELTGFETLSGIPGTLGGGIYMNAGAYGGELSSVVEAVTYLDENGEVITQSADKLGFGYRKSIFQNGKLTVLSCVLHLKKGSRDEILEAMKDYNHRRSSKQPLSMPSAGSTFKRPEGYFAGKLIQDSGLMGFSIGGAQVSEKHAGFIVNKGGATARDVLDLIEYVQKTVYDKFSVHLEPEVRLIGEV